MRTHYTRFTNIRFLLLVLLTSLVLLCGFSWFLLNETVKTGEPANATLPTFTQAPPSTETTRSLRSQSTQIEEGEKLEQTATYFEAPRNTLQAILQIPQAARTFFSPHVDIQSSSQFSQPQGLTRLFHRLSAQAALILTHQQAAWKASILQAPPYQSLLTTALTALAGLPSINIQAQGVLSQATKYFGVSGQTRAVTPAQPSRVQASTPAPKAPTSQTIPGLAKLLYASSEQDKINPELYRQLQNIFKDVVRLEPNLRHDERFSVIYDRQGRIQLATVTIRNKTYQAIRYTDARGYTGYYSPAGKALKKFPFLTTPVKYTRISDRFSLQRWHPILHVMRPHYGIDYAAPTGTPIRAISSGHIHFAGWNKGYGNTVIIRHNKRYRSLYAHMSRIGHSIKPGQWVTQGQIIGYVGSTGLATGPHLHFGLYEYGKAVDPEKILPKSNPPLQIAQNELAAFLAKTNQLTTQLAWNENHMTS